MAAVTRVRSIMTDQHPSDSPLSSPTSSTISRTWTGSSISTLTTRSSVESLPFSRKTLGKKRSLPSFKSKLHHSHEMPYLEPLSPSIPKPKAIALPPDLYDAIFTHLEAIRRLDHPSRFVQDMSSVALVSKAWSFATHPKLYHTIFMSLADLQSTGSSKWFSPKQRSRLKTLRATLRNSPWRARLVRRIVVTDGADLAKLPDSLQTTALQNLATLVDACPCLEQLAGIAPIYKHDYTRLDHALSTRKCLRSHVWTIGPNEEIWNGQELSPDLSHLHAVPIPEQVDHFVSLHSRWSILHTLVIQGQIDANLSHDRLLPFAFMALPSIRNLAIINFIDSDFDDTHLFFLPKTLTSLRLEKLPGVTETGIHRYLTQTLPAETRWAFKSLALLDLVIHRTAFLSTTLPALPALDRLAIRSPYLTLPANFTDDPALPPPLSSPCLKYLSWDLHGPDGKETGSREDALAVNDLLASCILRSGFPSLRSVFVPYDPSGVVQGVCRPLLPRAPMAIPDDEHRSHALAAYMRAAQGLGFAIPQGTARHSMSEDRDDLSGFAIECTDELGNIIGRWEAPKFVGRAEGTGVPFYNLRGWVEDVAEVMKGDGWGVDLHRLFDGRGGRREKVKVVRRDSRASTRSTLSQRTSLSEGL